MDKMDHGSGAWNRIARTGVPRGQVPGRSGRIYERSAVVLYGLYGGRSRTAAGYPLVSSLRSALSSSLYTVTAT